jgi:threonine/homoserine/homoserine lactone efflux protein
MNDLFLPLILFATVSTVTPGPNNLLLTASGLNFGLRRSLPHLFGVGLGFPAMLLLVGLGLAGVFERVPLLHLGLKWVALIYLAILAWRIARAPPVAADGALGAARPMRFWHAVLFQWVNPKAWVMAVSATTGYTTVRGDSFREVLLISAVFLVIGLPSALLWTGFGTVMRRWLQSPLHVRLFNITMALLLVASLIPILRD